MTNFLSDALAYAGMGLSILPIRNSCDGDKKAAVKWTKFQTSRPTDADLRRWFGPGSRLRGLTGLAVVLGPVSGGLYCRDFDDAEAYWRWARACPELAGVLPTVKTARGFHVYGRWLDAQFATMPDGEFRAGGTHYVVLPPSIHPTRALYEWRVPLLDGEDIPLIEPVAAMLIPCETEQAEHAEQPQQTEQTEQSEAVTGGLSAVPDFQRAQTSARSVTPEMLERLRDPIGDAIRRTLPGGEGRRNRAVFQLARALKGIPELADADVKGLRPVVRDWHRQALPKVKTKDFVSTWADFIVAWGRVRLPMGESRMDKALERTRTSTPPAVAADYLDNPQMVRLLCLCRELQHEHGKQPFFLSCRMAEKALGIDHGTANRYLRVLVTDGVLIIHEKGQSGASNGRATRFRYVGGD